MVDASVGSLPIHSYILELGSGQNSTRNETRLERVMSVDGIRWEITRGATSLSRKMTWSCLAALAPNDPRLPSYRWQTAQDAFDFWTGVYLERVLGPTLFAC